MKLQTKSNGSTLHVCPQNTLRLLQRFIFLPWAESKTRGCCCYLTKFRKLALVINITWWGDILQTILNLSNLGFIVLSNSDQSTQLYHRSARKQISASAYLTLSAKTRKQEKLLTSRIHIKPVEWSNYSPGNKALDSLGNSKDKESVKSFSRKLYRVLKDLDDVIVSKYNQSQNARLLKFGTWTEPVPNPESRVLLGEERDALDQRRVILDWRIGEQEKGNLIGALKIMAAELGCTGLGRMKIDFNEDSAWPWKSMAPGLHHMGTTRMHTDEPQGVGRQKLQSSRHF